jgi:hypothetical protein
MNLTQLLQSVIITGATSVTLTASDVIKAIVQSELDTHSLIIYGWINEKNVVDPTKVTVNIDMVH